MSSSERRGKRAERSEKREDRREKREERYMHDQDIIASRIPAARPEGAPFVAQEILSF